MRSLFKRLWKDESGITATEYGILAAIFAAALITILTTFRGKVKDLFTDAGNDIASASSSATP
jgi:pilus assembly protein Flp/PilA